MLDASKLWRPIVLVFTILIRPSSAFPQAMTPAPQSETSNTPVAGVPHPTAEQGISGPCEPETIVTYGPPQNTLSAAFYFPWHRGSPPDPRWLDCTLRLKPQDPRPVLGLYNSAEQTVVNTHLDWMVQNGVKVVAVEWFGLLNSSRFEEDLLVNQIIPAIEARNLQFVLLYDLAIRVSDIRLNCDDTLVRERFTGGLRQFASTYFKPAKYLKFDNKLLSRRPAADFVLDTAPQGLLDSHQPNRVRPLVSDSTRQLDANEPLAGRPSQLAGIVSRGRTMS